MVVYLPNGALTSGAATRLASRSTRPAADVYRDGDDYVLAVELPGVEASSIDIDVSNQVLTVKAERTPRLGEGVTWIARERATGSVQRRFSLGRSVDTESISANYVNGVLHVVLPVSEASKPRKVEVSTTSPAVSASEAPAAAESASAEDSAAVAA